MLSKDFLTTLTDTDKEVLRSIYLLRCLDEPTILETYYAPEGRTQDYVMRRIRKFVKCKVIEKVKYGEEWPALFLTTSGVGLLRYYLTLPDEIYIKQKKKTILGVYNSNDLKLDPRVIKHQIYLNRFVSKFKIKADKLGIPWAYFDEKYLSKYTSIRPDGMIRIGGEDLFLEMDMGTEKNTQLRKKWENYRTFIRSEEYFQREQNIKVLFIVGNVKNTELKARRVKSLIYDEIVDIVDSDIDFYVADQDTLLNTVFEKLIPSCPYVTNTISGFKMMLTRCCGFLVSSGDKLSHILGETKFDFYARKLNNNKKILVQDGETQEYLIDLYVGKPVSVLKKIAYMGRTSSAFEVSMKRPIKYIVVIEDEKDFYQDLKAIGIEIPSNVYFTTENRLRNMIFYEALFQYDMLGSIVHFNNYSFSGKVFERSL